MQKIIALCLAGMALIGLFGCGSKDTEEDWEKELEKELEELGEAELDIGDGDDLAPNNEQKSGYIDLDKLVKIDFGEYNGYGTPSAELDTEYLQSVTNRKGVYGDDGWWLDLEVEFSQAYNNLKNGDKVTYALVIDEDPHIDSITLDAIEAELQMKFSATSKTITVSGLKEPANVIDIFEGIEQYIYYSGTNGNGSVSAYHNLKIPDDYNRQIGDIYLLKYGDQAVSVIYNNKNIGHINFYSEEFKNLSMGDIVLFTLPNSIYDTSMSTIGELEKLGYTVPRTRILLTVPDLGEYITSQEQFTSEIIDAIKTEVKTRNSIDGDIKLYYATYKPGIECPHDSSSFVIAIYSKPGYWGDIYYYYINELNDIIIKPDGTILIEDYNNPLNKYASIEAAEAELDTTKCIYIPLN